MIETIRKGDIVLSRHEFKPDGPAAGKVVEEVFVRVSPLSRVVVGDREIHVTPEHPFFAEGRGWIAAGLLNLGAKLHTLEGERLAVRLVEDTGEVKTVYNFRVAEFSTRFGVGIFLICKYSKNDSVAKRTVCQRPTPDSCATAIKGVAGPGRGNAAVLAPRQT